MAATVYRVIRNDGRDVLRFSFTSKREAQKAAREQHSDSQPFTYRVQKFIVLQGGRREAVQ